MTKYPNRDALREANDIYLDYMRPFVIHHLKQVPGKTVEDLIAKALPDEQVDMFWAKLDKDDDIESAIDFSYFPLIIKENWLIKQNRRNYGFAQRFNGDIDIQSMLWLIKKGRNYCEHRGTKDLDSELVRVNLFFLADVLGKINRPDRQRKVEVIRDELVSDNTDDTTERSEKLEEEKAELAKRLEEVEAERMASEEHLTDKSNLLESTEAENAELKKLLSERENRLKTVESQRDERIKTLSEQLIDNATKLEAKEETLSTLSDQLRTIETEKARLEERLKDSPKQPETSKVGYEERLQTTLKQLKTANAVKAELEERLETTSTRLEAVEAELTTCQEHLARTLRQLDEAKAEQTEYLLAEEHLARALTDERVVLPTGIEMEQPVLEFLADRKEYPRVEIIDLLTKHFSLTDDERKYLSKSGRAEKHLMNTDLIERTRIGYYRITVDGLEVLHQNAMDEDNVFSNEVYTESQSYSESPAQSPKSQRKWRHHGAVAALRDPTEIREVEAKIARILNPSEKSRLERELRAAKRAAFL